MKDSSKGFEQLCIRVRSGEQLARTTDLIRGAPFFRDDILADAAAFAERVMGRLGAPMEITEALLFALSELTVAPDTNDFLIAADAFEALVGKPEGETFSAKSCGVRCRFYAGISGHCRSWNEVAAFAVSLMYSPELPEDEARAQAVATVLWLLVSTGQRKPPEKWTMSIASKLLATVEVGPGPGPGMVLRLLDSRQRLRPWAAAKQAAGIDVLEAPPNVVAQDREPPAVAMDFRCTGEAFDENPTTLDLVVFKSIGNVACGEGKRVASEFQSLVGQPLPLAPLPDLAAARRDLIAEFPHATSVVDTVFAAVGEMAFVRLAPMLFVGPAGSGKTTFAVRLAQILGLPTEVFSCGGISDGAVAGTPRRWATSEPSLPVSAILAHQHAGPCIILDEIEKAGGTSKGNGSFHDALLGMVERSTARHFRDPYLEASVDLTGIVWIGTANSLEGLPRPLIDRFRAVPFPAPRGEHLVCLANAIIRRVIAERGLHPGWAASLNGYEQTALSSTWHDGSLRSLERMVQTVLICRERADAVH